METHPSNSQPIPPEQPVVLHSRKILSPLTISIGIVFILLMLGGIFVITQPKNAPPTPIQKQTTTTPSPTQQSHAVIANGTTYTDPSHRYSFQYNPAEVNVIQPNTTDIIARIITPAGQNSPDIDINLLKNPYNRPFETVIQEYTGKTDFETTTLDGLVAKKILNRLAPNEEELFVQNGSDIYWIIFYNYGDLSQNTDIYRQILSTLHFQKPTPTTTPQVQIVNGDIVVMQNGKEVKVTQWGYNSDATLSPDKSKIAYISTTKETLDFQKTMKGYIPVSSNVWIINADGSNPIQLTQHDNFVLRGNLYWLDNNRLLFTDGTNSAKVYNLLTKKTDTVMGPTKPEGICADACGFEIKSFYTPDHSYLVTMESSQGNTTKITILNTKNLQSTQLPDQPYGSGVDSVTFPNNHTIQFNSYTKDSTQTTPVSIDLTTQQTTSH